MQTYGYGFPRLGEKREYKKIIEGFWNKKISEQELRQTLRKLEEERLATYEKYVDKFPLGEMTLYDNMLDTAIMVGLYRCKNLEEYYNLCRGKDALELTKWFNTNYHYLVPEFNQSFNPSEFEVFWNKPKEEKEIHKNGIPYLIGPFTFLKLSKGINPERFGEYLLSLADVYIDLIKDFDEVHIDEPAFVMELSKKEVDWIKQIYNRLGSQNPNINLFTYYDSVDFLRQLYDLPIKAIGLDFINGKENLSIIREQGFPREKTLIAGIVNGRNIWRTDIDKTVELLKELSGYVENLIISNAAPLYHLPITTESEQLDKRLLKKIAFAKERLAELKLIAQSYTGKKRDIEDKDVVERFGINPKVQERVKNLKGRDFKKSTPYDERIKKQREILNLPLFPTTTIGSFPQTEVRKKRADFNSGKISEREYKDFIKKEIRKLIKLQKNLDLDVFVHGEFERTDMVEFFAQKLDGIATTQNGWIISYGTRVYRPPIIYGDVSRPAPMTVEEISFAQSLSRKPVKGMLTGPVTMVAWSFVREDISIYEVAYQIALCLQDEIRDYEREGIKIVQIDEPAFREKAPIKRRDWDKYFEWAVNSFNLASQSKPETQIHTHMCYSEFGEIIEYILKMDFDVISIEASRSKGDVIEAFRAVDFKRQIGLGVWDVHSSLVPDVEDMAKVIKRALEVFPRENLWINPDCGLKTRKWEETIASLRNLVKLAKKMRKEKIRNEKHF